MTPDPSVNLRLCSLTLTKTQKLSEDLDSFLVFPDVQWAKIQHCNSQRGGVLGSAQHRTLQSTKLSGSRDDQKARLPYKGTAIGRKNNWGEVWQCPCILSIFKKVKREHSGGRSNRTILIQARHSWTVAFPVTGHYRCYSDSKETR